MNHSYKLKDISDNKNKVIKSCSCCVSDDINVSFINNQGDVYTVIQCNKCGNKIFTQQLELQKILFVWNS